MSQIYKTLVSGGPIPPAIPTEFSTDIGGPAVPVANNLNIFGQQNFVDNDAGIRTEGIGDTVLVQLTNRLTDNVTTTDATLTTLLTFPLDATPGVYFVSGSVQAFGAAGPHGGAYSFAGGYMTDGATATELGTEFHDSFETLSMVASDIFLATSGNNVLVQVQGIAASLNWNGILEYRVVT